MWEKIFPAFSADFVQRCNFTNRFKQGAFCVNTNKKNFINFYIAPREAYTVTHMRPAQSGKRIGSQRFLPYTYRYGIQRCKKIHRHEP